MSSLWTPGGEVPVDRNRGPAQPSTPPPAGGDAPPAGDRPGHGETPPTPEEIQEALARTSGAEVVTQQVLGLIEIAAMFLSGSEPRLADASIAIDAAHAALAKVGPRLGPSHDQLRDALGQLQMAYVQLAGEPAG